MNRDNVESDEVLAFLHPLVDDRQPVFNFPRFVYPFNQAMLVMLSIDVDTDQGHLFYLIKAIYFSGCPISVILCLGRQTAIIQSHGNLPFWGGGKLGPYALRTHSTSELCSKL